MHAVQRPPFKRSRPLEGPGDQPPHRTNEAYDYIPPLLTDRTHPGRRRTARVRAGAFSGTDSVRAGNMAPRQLFRCPASCRRPERTVRPLTRIRRLPRLRVNSSMQVNDVRSNPYRNAVELMGSGSSPSRQS